MDLPMGAHRRMRLASGLSALSPRSRRFPETAISYKCANNCYLQLFSRPCQYNLSQFRKRIQRDRPPQWKLVNGRENSPSHRKYAKSSTNFVAVRPHDIWCALHDHHTIS
ncbi:hypothetical protein MPH_00604 [Macrophomina phaseolina MS6]|uniref:Uncharacterized protein n=1 Tax=Macrophomina phaseolina (strain MS6) TaxID=1126212 RepID=K2S538_MACPH|nr:hypothetical protein MPH_00604 [Macrophomina phaseolina MS6]